MKPAPLSSSHYPRSYYLGRKHSALELGTRKQQRIAIVRQALNLVPALAKGPFLDVGCGTGELVLELAKRGKRAEGIDFSPAAISICRQALALEKNPIQDLCHFQIADCTRLPFATNRFYCLFYLDLVEHLNPHQLRQTFIEANRVLRKNGRLIIHTNNKYFEHFTKLLVSASYHGLKVFLRPKKILSEANKNKYERLHINYMTASELSRNLKDIGFSAQVVYVKPKNIFQLAQYIPYNEAWKRYIYLPIAWILLNTFLQVFMSPTFWLIAEKKAPQNP